MVSAAFLFIEAIADTQEGNVWIDFVELVEVCMYGEEGEVGWSFISSVV